MGEITLHVAQIQNSCNTVYSSDMVCFTYISVSTLHEGEKDDDDDNNNNNNGSWDSIVNIMTGLQAAFSRV
jgi:hypothetical protein